MTPAVFIPGLLCTGAVFAPQTKAFAQDLDIVIADHTGQDSIASIARAILERAPDRFVLAGLSLGGIIALEIMVQAGERVMALVLLDTGARADTPEQAERRRAFIGFTEQVGLAVGIEKTLPLMLHETRQGDQTLRDTMFEMAETVGIKAFRRQQTALLERRDYRTDLAAISSPTLVIVGEGDAMTPVERSQELAASIPGARLDIIAGCGHISTLEHPDEVNARMAGFLQTHGLIGAGRGG